jgi:hypothetical protein
MWWSARSSTVTIEPGEAVALGFDGSLNDDSTVLIASRMSDGFFFPVGIWAKPEGPEGNWWEVPRSDVLATIREAFARYDVTRLYADPHEWRTDIDDLAGEFGEKRVTAVGHGRDVRWPPRWTGCTRGCGTASSGTPVIRWSWSTSRTATCG